MRASRFQAAGLPAVDAGERSPRWAGWLSVAALCFLAGLLAAGCTIEVDTSAIVDDVDVGMDARDGGADTVGPPDSGSDTAVPEATGRVAFFDPVEGTVFVPEDDREPSIEGVQILLLLEYESPDEPGFLEVDGPADSWTLPTSQTVLTALVQRDGFSLGLGTNTLSATLLGASGQVLASVSQDIVLEVPVVPTLTFTQPLDGAVLSAVDDLDAAAPGLQVELTAATREVPAGAAVQLWVNDVLATAAPQVQADGVRWPTVTLPAGPVALRASVAIGRQTVSDAIDIEVADVADRCSISLALPSPRGPAACTWHTDTVDTDPAQEGLQVDLDVETTCTTLTLRLDDRAVDTVVPAAGRARFQHVTVQPGNQRLEVTGSGAAQSGSTGRLRLLAGLVPPMLVEVDSVEALPTATGTAQPFTARGTLATATAPTWVELNWEGATTSTPPATATGAWAAVDLPVRDTGDFAVSLVPVDGCGNRGSPVVETWRTYATWPALAFATPDAVTELRDDQVDPDNVAIVPVGLVGGWLDGTLVQIVCTSDQGTLAVGSATFADGTATGQLSFSLSSPRETFQCRARALHAAAPSTAPTDLTLTRVTAPVGP